MSIIKKELKKMPFKKKFSFGKAKIKELRGHTDIMFALFYSFFEKALAVLEVNL